MTEQERKEVCEEFSSALANYFGIDGTIKKEIDAINTHLAKLNGKVASHEEFVVSTRAAMKTMATVGGFVVGVATVGIIFYEIFVR